MFGKCCATSSIWRFNCDLNDELDFVAPGEKYGTMHFKKSAQANFGGNMALRHFFNDSEYNARLMVEHTTFGNWIQLKGVSGWYMGETSSDFLGLSYDSNTPFKFYCNGKMSIGDVSANTFGEYRLYVEKGILTEKVKVAFKTSAEWSDFVFEPRYQLMPLSKLQKYILKEKHLPEIPSAEKMVENGLDLAEMDKKLLQKIEELTL
jgi:hypothetical protein